MQNTWRFTRLGSLFFKYVETFFYSLISNTENIIYLCMMASMYQSAGLISVPYPFAIFGYALIEETRPRDSFWNWVRIYTTIILTIKFIFNLQIFDSISASDGYRYWSGMLRIGLRKENESIHSIIAYLLPEILIVTFIMLNQIKLRLIGLYNHIEEDIENIDDGIQRYISQGDIQKVQEDKIKRTHMDMDKYFISYLEQKDALEWMEKESKKQTKMKGVDQIEKIERVQEEHEEKKEPLKK